MSLNNWTPGLSVGVFRLDADHVILVGLINQLYDAMSEGRGEDLFDTILVTMREYTVSHFNREEGLLKKQNYPDYEGHKRHHENLIGQLDAFARRYAENDASLTADEMADFLKGWLVNHIQKADFAYKPFMPTEELFDC